jgi:hypothetical protein
MLMVNKTDEDNDHSDDLLTDTIMTRRMKEEEVVVEKKDGGGGRQSEGGGGGGEASKNAVPVTPASLWHLLLLTLPAAVTHQSHRHSSTHPRRFFKFRKRAQSTRVPRHVERCSNLPTVLNALVDSASLTPLFHNVTDGQRDGSSPTCRMVYTPCLVTNKVFFSSNLEVMRQQQAAASSSMGGCHAVTGVNGRRCTTAVQVSIKELGICLVCSSAATESCPEWSVAGAAQGHRALFTQRRRLISGQQLGRRVTRRCAVGSDLNCI